MRKDLFGSIPFDGLRIYKPEPDCHLMQRKEGMNASNLALFERFFIIFVKIELCESKTWCYFRNLLYLCHDDLFSFPPKRAIQSCLGDFLFLMQRYKIFMTLVIKSLDLFELICDYP